MIIKHEDNIIFVCPLISIKIKTDTLGKNRNLSSFCAEKLGKLVKKFKRTYLMVYLNWAKLF